MSFSALFKPLKMSPFTAAQYYSIDCFILFGNASGIRSDLLSTPQSRRSFIEGPCYVNNVGVPGAFQCSSLLGRINNSPSVEGTVTSSEVSKIAVNTPERGAASRRHDVAFSTLPACLSYRLPNRRPLPQTHPSASSDWVRSPSPRPSSISLSSVAFSTRPSSSTRSSSSTY